MYVWLQQKRKEDTDANVRGWRVSKYSYTGELGDGGDWTEMGSRDERLGRSVSVTTTISMHNEKADRHVRTTK